MIPQLSVGVIHVGRAKRAGAAFGSELVIHQIMGVSNETFT